MNVTTLYRNVLDNDYLRNQSMALIIHDIIAVRGDRELTEERAKPAKGRAQVASRREDLKTGAAAFSALTLSTFSLATSAHAQTGGANAA
ncbi:hypothetical protein A4A59_028650 (plasmid) [Rhizobium leguminosarum]|uniref:Uncharacterized protein n=1 Tax=Rhizobium leguminosarum TaxID=384 RepID=A0ACD5FEJ7_RHILE